MWLSATVSCSGQVSRGFNKYSAPRTSCLQRWSKLNIWKQLSLTGLLRSATSFASRRRQWPQWCLPHDSSGCQIGRPNRPSKHSSAHWPSKGYSHCVDVYIKQCQEGAYLRNDIFDDSAVLCQRVSKQVGEIFSSPEAVLAKLIQNVFEVKLQNFVKNQLEECRKSDAEQYLKNLYDLYTRTTNLSSNLMEFNLGTDKQTFLSKLIKAIFLSYLENYIDVETGYLKSRSSMILQRYYDSKNHQKRPIGSGGIQDLKERIRQRTNLPLGPSIDTHGETFLAQEVVVNLLQETKQAFERCHKLSDPSDLPRNAFRIFTILVDYLCIEHIDYALEIGLAAIPSPDSKNANLYFLDVVHQANTIFHLFDKQFNDHLMPLISSSPKLTECLQKKKDIIEQMEVKLDTGIDRTLNCMIGQMKHILIAEQKKTDFKPEDENNVLIQYTNACVKVCGYVRKQVEKIRNSMDGKNVDTVLMEFGVRFHRLIYEHLQQYSYSSMGGMLAICDVAEYRKCAKDFKSNSRIQLLHLLLPKCSGLQILSIILQLLMVPLRLVWVHSLILSLRILVLFRILFRKCWMIMFRWKVMTRGSCVYFKEMNWIF
ncbi:exocyst complex component 5 isoform X4 [Rhinatrema bivittatum]|uniref:exocyst complex component 5 isoform X4 n=1 Tax=Rhinatrema bivittatum TaxID=194408 RepID=UPI00112E68FC|nr:exocyst complex component 5 isoform X4 [Rhinatrema bivittatum]